MTIISSLIIILLFTMTKIRVSVFLVFFGQIFAQKNSFKHVRQDLSEKQPQSKKSHLTKFTKNTNQNRFPFMIKLKVEIPGQQGDITNFVPPHNTAPQYRPTVPPHIHHRIHPHVSTPLVYFLHFQTFSIFKNDPTVCPHTYIFRIFS